MSMRRKSTAEPSAGSSKWEIVILLWFAYFLNQADRKIFGITLPLIQEEFALSSFQMGLVATVFLVVFGLLVPIAGLAGDRFNRGKIVVLSLAIFSIGTFATGLATSYIMLLVFRGVATGAGEAFYSPAATALIGERHTDTRARALSIHQSANYTGVIISGLLIGWAAELYGWRSTFLTFGFAGVLLASFIWLRLRRATGTLSFVETPVGDRRLNLREVIKVVWNNPALKIQVLGLAGLMILLSGYTTWMPTMIYEKFNVTLAEAGASAIVLHHVMAYIGLSTSALTDRYRSRFPSVRMYSMGVSLTASGLFLWLAANAESQMIMQVALGAFGFARGVYDSNIYAAVFDQVENRLRSSVAGVMVSVAFLIGALAPVAMGAVKDTYGLSGGIELISLIAGIAGCIFLWSVYRQRGLSN